MFQYITLNGKTGQKFKRERTFENRTAFIEQINKWNQQLLIRQNLNDGAIWWIYIESYVGQRALTQNELDQMAQNYKKFKMDLNYLDHFMGEIK